MSFSRRFTARLEDILAPKYHEAITRATQNGFVILGRQKVFQPPGEPKHEPEDVQSILHAALEVNGRRLGKVARRYGDLTHAEAETHRLGHDLLVEHKVVRVEQKGQRFEQSPTVGSKASVVLG